MDGSRPDRPAIEPWRHRATDAYGRRYELFALAAPVFARHGFRGATIRAIAHACHLSPAGLYHYFGSKEDLATCLVRGPRLGWDSTYVDPNLDPLIQLRELVGLAIGNIGLYLLSLRLLEEIEGRADETARTAAFREGEVVLARFISAAAPRLEREAALQLGRDLLAVLVGSSIVALDPEPAGALRRRLIDLLRDRLVPDQVEAGRFAAVMGDAR